MQGAGRSNAFELVSASNASAANQKLVRKSSSLLSKNPATVASPTSPPAQFNAEAITTDQVRDHLEQLGHFNIPQETLEQFRQELVARLQMQSLQENVPGFESTDAASNAFNEDVGQEKLPCDNNVVCVEKTSDHKRQSGFADRNSFRGLSKPISARERQGRRDARSNDVELEGKQEQPRRNVLQEIRDNTNVPSDEGERRATKTTDSGQTVRNRVWPTRLRETRLGGQPVRVFGGGYEGDESEFDNDHVDPESDVASEHVEGSQQSLRQSVRSSGKVSVTCDRSRCCSVNASIIRLAPHTMGRVQKRSDPVSGYWKSKEVCSQPIEVVSWHRANDG